MRFGLFGKLQAKRDFIAIATPRAFLSAWEPWLQAGMSSSRMLLTERWQEAFLTAPVWRFWLGADICGTTALGAMMPSMDGVGRYFPLTLVAFADEGEMLSPPELDPFEDWFAAIEDFLFSTLDGERSFDETTAALAALPGDIGRPSPTDADGMHARGSTVFAAPDGFSKPFAQWRVADCARSYAGLSFWWTAGGESFPRRALATPRLPDPHLFAGILTGDFAERAAPASIPR